MACQRLVTILAGIIDAAAFHLDSNDVESGLVMSAMCFGVKIKSTNFGVWRCHRR